MATASDLPTEYQELLSKLRFDKGTTMVVLVEDMGLPETMIAERLRDLERSGWVISTMVPEALPSGSAGAAYRRIA